jgi:hypothetical protein
LMVLTRTFGADRDTKLRSAGNSVRPEADSLTMGNSPTLA